MTPRIDFVCRYVGETVTISTDAVMLPEVVEAFERFLRAAGFNFDGHLEFAGDDDGADDFGMAED